MRSDREAARRLSRCIGQGDWLLVPRLLHFRAAWFQTLLLLGHSRKKILRIFHLLFCLTHSGFMSCFLNQPVLSLCNNIRQVLGCGCDVWGSLSSLPLSWENTILCVAAFPILDTTGSDRGLLAETHPSMVSSSCLQRPCNQRLPCDCWHAQWKETGAKLGQGLSSWTFSY